MKADSFRQRAQGVFAILITPFSQDGTVDVEGIHTHVERLAQANIAALIVNGTLSESYAMSTEEHKVCISAAVEAAQGAMVVVAGASSSATLESLEIVRWAERVGADAALITPPYFSNPPMDGVIAHFAHIAENTSLPVMVYNTSRAGRLLSVDQLQAIGEISGVEAVKQGTRDIVQLEWAAAKLRDRISVIGVEETMLPSLMYGACGFTSAAAIVFPELISRIYAAGARGDISEATRLYLQWQPYRFFHQSIGGPATHKAALREMHLPAGASRLPMADLSADQLAELRAILDVMDT